MSHWRRLLPLLLLTLAPSAGAEDRDVAASPEVYDLERCIETALASNRELLVQREEERNAGHRIREAWAGALPQIGFEGTYNRNLKRPAFFFRADEGFGGEGGDAESSSSDVIKIEIGSRYDYTGTFTLRQPLWLAGKVGAALKAAKLYDRSSEEEVERGEQDVVFRVRSAFYAALLAEEQVQVFREAYEQAERHLETTALRNENGLASDYELLRAEVARSEAEPDRIAAENEARKALDELKLLLGIDIEKPVEIRGALDYVPLPEERIIERGERAVEERPDRRALDLQVKLLEQNVRAVRSDLFPNLYLTGNYQLTGSSDEWNRFSENERTVSAAAGVYVTFPLWTSGATGAKIRQARGEMRIAKIRLEEAEERIRKEVRAARFDMNAAEERAEATERTMAQAEKAYEIAEARYENGLMTQIELLDARLALTRARVTHLRALHDALVARAAWMRTVGIGRGEE